jgi:hypothetical protein
VHRGPFKKSGLKKIEIEFFVFKSLGQRLGKSTEFSDCLKLRVQGIRQEQNGGYTCRAENRQGNASSPTLNLSIKCKIHLPII